MFESYDDILTVEDVSKILKLGTCNTYKLIRSGKIKVLKEGRSWKIPKKELEAYINNNLV